MNMTAERLEEKEVPKSLPPISMHDLIMSLFRKDEQHPRPKGKPATKHAKHSSKH